MIVKQMIKITFMTLVSGKRSFPSNQRLKNRPLQFVSILWARTENSNLKKSAMLLKWSNSTEMSGNVSRQRISKGISTARFLIWRPSASTKKSTRQSILLNLKSVLMKQLNMLKDRNLWTSSRKVKLLRRQNGTSLPRCSTIQRVPQRSRKTQSVSASEPTPVLIELALQIPQQCTRVLKRSTHH